ncbi:uncharacterized protein LOC121827228 [Peromyscus maniculatus bairdii]|uniref:uncharacterized protein LOC121827228 n=1 Tax=Peromyscus maniculatus bairdii TaxID=230844 RepID=UPI003FD539A1
MKDQCDHQFQTSKKVKLSGKKRETPPAGCDDQSSKDSRTIPSCWREACSGLGHRLIGTCARALETGAQRKVCPKISVQEDSSRLCASCYQEPRAKSVISGCETNFRLAPRTQCTCKMKHLGESELYSPLCKVFCESKAWIHPAKIKFKTVLF